MTQQLDQREPMRHHSAPHQLETGAGCPAPLRSLIAGGAPVLIQARVSNPAGQASYRAAVQNLFTAAQKLADHDVLPTLPDLLPSKQRLTARLHGDSEVWRSEDADGSFENRFLTLTLPACEQVHIHLSCGSGRKVDLDTLHQPVARHSATYIRKISPALVCAAEVSRWARGGWSLAPWSLAIQSLEDVFGAPAFLSFDGDTPKAHSQAVETELFLRANNAAHETKDMRARTTSAVKEMLPSPDEGGFCAYPLSTAPPPPLATAWRVVAGAGSRPQQVVFIDTPAVRKKLQPSIVYGMPSVIGADGKPVDQLKLVRFFLAHRGLPGWTPTRLAQYLADHLFSTEGMRRQHGTRSAAARMRPGNKNDVWHLMKCMEDHLEFYRTGQLHRGIGDKRDPVLITTLLPSDGLPYVHDDDYVRVRALVEENQIKYTRHRRYTFGHHPVTYDGRPGSLVAHADEDDQVVYRVRRKPRTTRSPGRRNGSQPTPRTSPRIRRPAPVIPADLFALSLVDGLVAGSGDLTSFIAPPEPAADEATERLQHLQLALERKQGRRGELYAALFPSRDDPRAPTGQLRRDAEAEYEEVHDEITLLERTVGEAREQAERHRVRRDPRTIAVQDLLAVVASLREPQNIHFHEQWRHAVHDLRIAVEPRREHGVLHYDTTWTGTLLVHQGRDQRAITFTGTSARPTGGRQHGVVEAIAALRQGHGLALSTWANTERRNQLRHAMGVPPGAPMPALTIRDPRLLRIAMAVVYPPLPGDALPRGSDSATPVLAGPPLTPRQLPAAARRLAEPLALLKRVQATNPPAGYAPGVPRRWLCKGDRDVNQVCRLAAADGGTLYAADFELDDWILLRHAAKRCDPRLFTFRYGQMTLKPCPRCGGLAWAHLDIREATEPVCGDCRHDFAGIEWPADPYDQYAYGNHD